MSVDDFRELQSKILKTRFGYELHESTGRYYSKHGTLLLGNHGFYIGIIANGILAYTTKFDMNEIIETCTINTEEYNKAMLLFV